MKIDEALGLTGWGFCYCRIDGEFLVKPRHCERSEAISHFSRGMLRLLHCVRNDQAPGVGLLHFVRNDE